MRTPYRIFRPTYTERGTSARKASPTFHISFRDHLHRRQSLAGFTNERDTTRLAERVMQLVNARRTGESLARDMERWLQSLDGPTRDRLSKMEVIDARTVQGDTPLIEHLEGRTDAAGVVVANGWKQDLQSRGTTAAHVRPSIARVKRIIDGCGFTFWRDLIAPTAATSVSVFLGNLREARTISGKTFNYHVRELKSFCKWLHKTGRAPGLAMDNLERVNNADADAQQRRPLWIEEMDLLLNVTANSEAIRLGLNGDERAILYRFSFETGMRPNQVKALTVASFDLDGDPPTVTSHARYVKRRREHTQVLRPDLAQALRKRFQNKVPSAAAIRMPHTSHLADMLRQDLSDARAAWISQAKTPKEKAARAKSDFLADTSHRGEKAVFYSLRHGHGTALAAAGVPESAIAASMHHASRATTARYIHAGRSGAASAVAALPDLTYRKRPAKAGS